MADELRVRGTAIPGLLVVDLPVHGDARGWFKENWQRAKMVAAGLPDFAPVQHSVAHNGQAGVTRGVHAEPWDKFVSIVAGKAFGAWVDLREGPTFGVVHTEQLDEHTAVFVPRGVGNSYQTLVEGTVYSYLVNEHWSPDATYTMVNLADETIAIDWPIPLERVEVSAKDEAHPRLDEVVPVPPRRVLVLGADGQLGKALLGAIPGARGLTRSDLDLADPVAVANFDYSDVDTLVNAAALAAVEHRFILVHYSSDYVFDGTQDSYGEDDPFAPLSVYGASKAAGDLAVSVVPRHYLLRTAWVVGDGQNFVATMADLAARGVTPSVVADQVGRLTFTMDLARATAHLLTTGAPYGTYNVTSSGAPVSWADVARTVYQLTGADPALVSETSTDAYTAGKDGPVAPRPARSVLDLTKIEATGFGPTEQGGALAAYLKDRPGGRDDQ